MNTFIKRFIGFSIGPAGGAVIQFITIPLTTYFIAPQEFGKANMFSMLQLLFLSFLYLGLDQAYTREYHETEDKKNLIKNALFVPLIFSFVIFLLIILNINMVSSYLFDKENYHLAVVLFGFTIISLTVERFLLLSIRMEENALEYSILNIFIKLAILIFTLLFVIFIRKDFLAVVYSTAIGQLSSDVYLMIRYRKLLNFKDFHFDKELFLKLLKFGLPLIIASSLYSLLNSMDRISLRKWSTFTEIGIFTAAFKISSSLSIVQTSFINFWVPTAFRWYQQKKEIKHFEVVSNVMLLIMSVLFAFILLFKSLIVVLLSSNYEGTKFIIGFLCLQPIMYTVSETTTLGIAFSKKSYLNIFVSIVAIVPNLLLNITLVPKYGAIGASIATGVSYIFFFLGRSYFSKRNWEGFSLKIHVIVIFIIFFASLINTQNYDHILLINIGILLIILAVQIPTIKTIIGIYTHRNQGEWDFS
jgi:O-antigen/teichoic acid export membrane protein